MGIAKSTLYDHMSGKVAYNAKLKILHGHSCNPSLDKATLFVPIALARETHSLTLNDNSECLLTKRFPPASCYIIAFIPFSLTTCCAIVIASFSCTSTA